MRRTERTNKWKAENLKSYGVTLHKEYNKDLIEYVEHRKRNGDKTSEIFREGIENLIRLEKG